MESSGSSFIPQHPTRGKVAAKSFRKIYILSYVSYIVFFSTLLAVAGVFIYQLSLKAELRQLQETLVAQKNLFNQADLDRVRNLDYRIDAASQLVANHASVLTLFRTLENIAIQPIQILTFDYNRQESIREPQIKLTANADQFDQVLFQQQIFNNNVLGRRFKIESVSLATEPIDQNQLDLGVRQVVNLSLMAEIPVSDIGFTGFTNTNESASEADEEIVTDDIEDDVASEEVTTSDVIENTASSSDATF